MGLFFFCREMPAKENHSALRAGFRKIGPSPIFLKKNPRRPPRLGGEQSVPDFFAL
jgi:hypothetical protein